MRKIYIETLGCAKNQVESEYILGRLDGMSVTKDPQEAESIIVNTCGFLQSSREESIDRILELAELKEIGSCETLVVSGCLVESSEAELRQELPEVDLFCTPRNLDALAGFFSLRDKESGLLRHGAVERIDKDSQGILAQSAVSYGKRRYLDSGGSNYLKISEGCNHSCSFCTIPQFKGKLHSRSVEELIAEVRDMVAVGVTEINLVAQDLSSYGADLGNTRLRDLLLALVKVKGVKWIRLLYLYPAFIDDELIKIVKNEDKIARYFDIPLQHLDNRILRAMKRGGTVEEYIELIAKIRAEISEVAVRTTLITGFPGETEEIFEAMLDRVKSIGFNHLGVFEYSPEESTKSFLLPDHVNPQLAKSRKTRIMKAQARISSTLLKERVGSSCETLIEEVIPGDDNNLDYYIGRSEMEAPEVDGCVVVSSDVPLKVGMIVPVRIRSSSDYDLFGTVSPEPGEQAIAGTMLLNGYPT